jgi:hypothetical protein
VNYLGASDFLSLTKSMNHSLALFSSLAEHETTPGHHIDSRNVRILWRDNISYRLLINEYLVTSAHEPSLNLTTHSVTLTIFREGLESVQLLDPNG